MSPLRIGSIVTPRRSAPGVIVLAIAGLAAVMASQAVAQNVFNSDCIPPLAGTYAGSFHAKYADGTNVYDLTQPQHSKFTPCNPPPAAGCAVDAFSSFIFAQMSVNGAPSVGVNGPAQTRVDVCLNHQTGPTRFFDTEMLQLDLNAGGCVLIRESPTKQSLGKTAITAMGGGQFRIDSFFDVFTELSTDCGQTWHPSTDAAGNPYAGHVEIPGTVATQFIDWTNVKHLYQNP